ncbi:Similar to HD domain-containing protein YGL101W; acc. no. P53144 [Pyronema omphalodes CBS 100304]|uniref:5'-deoxynucleotidase n=1 Tax=Pyronema omphalodes (strain CBS 100304) TaxID=1076935 RepID=U4L8P9_PYROM|nr:Similar to HD domain-containing protein YGL101W; acc. no. P53144 [Pyronema omphalodes CBS 100304]
MKLASFTTTRLQPILRSNPPRTFAPRTTVNTTKSNLTRTFTSKPFINITETMSAPENTNRDMIKDWTLAKAIATISSPVTPLSTSPLHFLHIIQRLKTTPREGWRRFGILDGESIADHMYRMGIICMLAPKEEGLDSGRCVKMALVHDMAEALVGDITPVDGVTKDDKYNREVTSMEYLCSSVLKELSPEIADEFKSLWLEYEEGTTSEARFVKDVDCFELVVQTIEYEKQYDAPKDLGEFLHVRKRIQNGFVLKWVEDALEERKAYWDEKGCTPSLP